MPRILTLEPLSLEPYGSRYCDIFYITLVRMVDWVALGPGAR